MLSRRLFLSTAGATLALVPLGQAFGHARIVRSTSFDRLAGFDGMGALVAHAPELMPSRPAGGVAGYLRSEGLIAFPLRAAPGPAACERRLAAVRARIGGRPFGLIWWGGVAGPVGGLREVADALVLIDRIDAAGADRFGSGGPVLCHFAARRPAEERRAIELGLSAVARAGNPLSCHWYDAEPGFAARGWPDAEAGLAWRRTASFLRRTLAQSEPAGLPGAA